MFNQIVKIGKLRHFMPFTWCVKPAIIAIYFQTKANLEWVINCDICLFSGKYQAGLPLSLLLAG